MCKYKLLIFVTSVSAILDHTILGFLFLAFGVANVKMCIKYMCRIRNAVSTSLELKLFEKYPCNAATSYDAAIVLFNGT